MARRMVMAFALATALGLTAGGAQAAGWGIGGFGGVSIPVAQEDASNGLVFGGHLKLSLGGMLGIEPNVTYFKNGDWEFDELPGQTFEGSKITAIGVNLLLGGAGPATGFRFFPFAGVKYYNEKNDFRDFSDGTLGFNGGLGLEIGVGSIGIEARASGEVLPLNNDGSRKWVHILGGLNYYFGAK